MATSIDRVLLNPKSRLRVLDIETPVPLFQRNWEFAQILNLFILRTPRRILEVGTFHGGTLYQWIQHCYINVPLDEHITIVSIDSYIAGVDNRKLFRKWAEEFPNLNLVLLEGDSNSPEMAEAAKFYAPYDWIFIDADHYYNSVYQDWENYRPLANVRGVICFHDIITHANHPEIEVELLWREIQSEGYMTQEVVEGFPGQDWGGIGVVYL